MSIVPVNVDNFVRAETDRMFANLLAGADDSHLAALPRAGAARPPDGDPHEPGHSCTARPLSTPAKESSSRFPTREIATYR